MPEQSASYITLKEESVKVIYRTTVTDGKGTSEPLACYKQNGTLKMYRLVEMGYADIEEIYEPKAHL